MAVLQLNFFKIFLKKLIIYIYSIFQCLNEKLFVILLKHIFIVVNKLFCCILLVLSFVKPLDKL